MLSAAAFAFAAFPAAAQSDIQWDPYRAGPQAGYVAAREAESLVAPIALFPDTLVAQILMAATYPYDIEDAAAWVADPRNRRLVGYALADALEDMDWDPSVKALTSAPEVLRMMDERRDWTQRLGQAFMADQGGVMDAVQHLRRQARAAGRLYSDRYRRIVDRGGEIIIEPVSPSEMYVAFYDPAIAFGAWAYPEYPPYYFPRVYYDIVRPVPIVAPLWGWSSWDWRGRHLRLDVGRWRQLSHDRPNVIVGNTWHHDPGRNQGRQFRGGLDRTNLGRPDFGRPDFDRADPGRAWNPRGNDRRDNDRWGGNRVRGNEPSVNAGLNPFFHGRGPGLNQDTNQRWRGPENRERDDRNGRREASVNPGAAPGPTPDVNRQRFNGRGLMGSREEFNRQGRGDEGRQWRQDLNVNPAPLPQAQPAPVPQPEGNRFGRGGDRGEGRGWQRREQVNLNPTPAPQAQPSFPQPNFQQPHFQQPNFQRGRDNEQANAGGEFRGRGRFGGQFQSPQAAPQPLPQAQPQNSDTNRDPRRFHGRGRGDDPAR